MDAESVTNDTQVPLLIYGGYDCGDEPEEEDSMRDNLS